jgi:hypothetical protein
MCLFIAGSCQSTAFSSRTSVSARDEAECVHFPVMKLQLRVFCYRKISYVKCDQGLLAASSWHLLAILVREFHD